MKNICSIVDYKLDGLTVKTLKALEIHPNVFMPEGTEGKIHRVKSHYHVVFDFENGAHPFTIDFRGKYEMSQFVKLVDGSKGQPEPEHRKCRICGCTQYRACPGGCFWVEDDLCSSCEKLMTPKAH